ncbi:MAG: type II toxin-antitoxin system HicA family toxin [Vicinamibacterales bacterium]
MTLRLRRLSSRQLLQGLRGLGFDIVNIEGSHAKLRRVSPAGSQTLTVPLHDSLQPGTLVAIYRQVRRYVPEEEARPIFYR